MSNKSELEIIGKNLLNDFHLENYRKTFKYDFEIDFNDPEKSNENIKRFIKNKLNINFDSNYIDIIHKQIPETGLKYHIDDCVVVTKKSEPSYNKHRYIKISDNKYLYFNNRFNKLPTKTIIFYSSTFGIDFEGGILKLCDNTEIKPQKGSGLVFDSREVHMVTPIKSGIRQVSVVKLYNLFI